MARPREFEPDKAIGQIKNVFWKKGYEGTSLQDIEAATSLNKQSLYRLYGDKRGMYIAALRHYEEHEVAEAAAILRKAGSPKKRFQSLFYHVIDDALKRKDRRGCFLCNASIDQAQLDKKTQAVVSKTMNDIRTVFIETLRAASPYKQNKKMVEDKAAALLAAYFGLRVLIKAGMPERVLRNGADSSLQGV